jgi:hypothetical protein
VTFPGAEEPSVRAEIAGTGTAAFGRLLVNGTLDLNAPDADSLFDPALVGVFDPPAGARFDVITSAVPILNGFDRFDGATTPGGLVLLATRPDARTVAVVVGAAAPPPAPRVTAWSFDYATRQVLTLTFDQDVSAFLTRGDYRLENRTTGLTIPQSAGLLTYGPAGDRAELLLTHELPDGDYRLTVRAGDVANAAGVPAVEGVSFDFFALAGDANHDRSVDFNDLVALAQHYNAAGTFVEGDYNYDGTVDFNDLVILAQRYNTTLPPPPVASPAPAPVALSSTAREKSVNSVFSTTPVAKAKPAAVRPKGVARPRAR